MSDAPLPVYRRSPTVPAAPPSFESAPLDLLRRYDRPGPRYTSYPTAVEFHDGFREREYRERLAEATRRAVAAWGLELCALCPEEYSNTVTTVLLPEGQDADRLRGIILERFNMSLGTGLGRLKGRAFRLGHLGDFNELMLMGMLGGVEMGLSLAGIPFKRGGVDAAMEFLTTD